MSERMLRNTFVLGTILFLVVLLVMTVDSLNQVASARTPQLTDQVVAGKQVWQSKNCNDCHTILGIGGYYAPELTKTYNRRGGAWLQAFLKDPQKVLPGTTMPNENLTDQQAQNLVSFFHWVSQVDTNNWPPQPRFLNTGLGTSSQGQLLFQQKPCASCHRINGQGSNGPGPDLSHIGSQLAGQSPSAAEFLDKFLQDPKSVIPNSTMPAVSMTAAERQAIVQYLVGLK